MGTKAEVQITFGRITYKTVSDILDRLREADAPAYRTAMAGLVPQTRKILKMRADLKQHPTRRNVASTLGITIDAVERAEVKGLFALYRLFEDASGRKVTVRTKLAKEG
jgi:hypothetical protein